MQTIKIDDFWNNINSYDLIVDARSPKEFLESHIPGAINLFALNDLEYEEIGKIYKNGIKSEAKIKGASYLCINASKHLHEIHSIKKIGSKIAVYCAKGGMRSFGIATILSSVGYRVDRIEGGYKTYRNKVLDFLSDLDKYKFIVLHGGTGSGKSDLIEKLKPSIDIEKLANHYGSVFGGLNQKQPSIKMFQNQLSYLLLLNAHEPWIFIEGESRKLGSIDIPKSLYETMQKGLNVWIQTSIEDRVKRITALYQNMSYDFFISCMKRISPYISKKAYSDTVEAFSNANMNQTAYILLTEYYDKVYRKQNNLFTTIEHNDIKETLVKLYELKDQLS